MTIQEIKQAVDQGETVYWSTFLYVVVKDRIGQYLIKCTPNNYCIGLTNQAGDELNGLETDFFTIPNNS